MDSLRNLILWRYGRSTWQYDVLCVLILAFIFLTPPAWFARGELRSTAVHRSSASAVLIPADVDASLIEQRVRQLTGRTDARVRDARRVLDDSGRTIAYEVDIE